MSELLHHRLQGEGEEVVLLLNGGMMTHPAWEPISRDLVTRYQVLGCDFRGQLQSPGEAYPQLEDHLPDVVALLDALKLRRVHVLGTSFGGLIGLLLAAQHPERVRTLAAVTTVDRTPDGMRESSREVQVLTRRVLAGSDTRALHDKIQSDVYSPAYHREHADSLAERRRQGATLPRSWYRGLIGILKSIEDFDLAPALRKIQCPTLVVHAAHDAVMPEDRVQALARAIPQSELVVHPTSGHALVVEDPTWLSRTYLDFLDRTSSHDA